MKKLIVLMIAVMLVPLVWAVGETTGIDFCKDTEAPSAPTNIDYDDNIKLTWNAASDEPDCSGIDSYKVAREGVVYTVDTTSFAEGPLDYGTYTYEIWAVDKAGNVGEKATKTVTIKKASSGGSGGGSGGSGGGSGGSYYTGSSTSDSTSGYVCNVTWICSEWEDCIDGEQERSCVDTQDCGYDADKPDTERECSSTVTKSKLAATGGEDVPEEIVEPTEEPEEDDAGLMGITGRFLGGIGNGTVGLFLLLVAIIAGLLLFGFWKRKKASQ